MDKAKDTKKAVREAGQLVASSADSKARAMADLRVGSWVGTTGIGKAAPMAARTET